jgi:hypothetical protein
MKIKFLFLMFFVGSIAAHAQLSGGVRAGANYTNILGPSSRNYKFKFGYQAGGYIEYDFASKLSFQAEVNYSMKGFREKYSEEQIYGFGQYTITTNTEVDILYNVSYIDIPLILNLNFGQMGSYLGIGPQVSILANASWDGESSTSITNATSNPPTTTNNTVTQSGSSRDNFSPVDFGVVLGTGAKYENGLEYCIRGGYGITPMDGSGGSYHNLVISVTLGYAIGETSGSYSKDRRYKKKGKH